MASMGYGRGTGFFIAVAPQLYRLIRLAGVRRHRLRLVGRRCRHRSRANNAGAAAGAHSGMGIRPGSLTTRFTAAAAALIQVLLTLGLLGLWVVGERITRLLWLRFTASGSPLWRWTGAARAWPGAVALLPMLAIALGLALLILWSFAGRWRFPDALPALDPARLGATWAAAPWTWPPSLVVASGANAHCGGADHRLPGGGARHRADRRQPLAPHPLCAAARAAGDVPVRLAISWRRAARRRADRSR
jgi:hypothetical protein